MTRMGRWIEVVEDGWMVEWLWRKMSERALGDVFWSIDTLRRPDALNEWKNGMII